MSSHLDLAGYKFEMRDLIGRVMRNMEGPTRYGTPRWAVVSSTFCVGSTVARAMCKEFGLNPDDDLKKGKR